MRWNISLVRSLADVLARDLQLRLTMQMRIGIKGTQPPSVVAINFAALGGRIGSGIIIIIAEHANVIPFMREERLRKFHI